MDSTLPYWHYERAALWLESAVENGGTAGTGRIAVLELRDSGKRNALGTAMFESLHAALRQCLVECAAQDEGGFTLRALRLCGQGPAFCGGFDLEACNQTPALLRELVERLSAALQELRMLPVPVVAQVQGAALAGGCALLAGCDFVIVAPDAQLGYPVHRIGVSPAVSLPAVIANAGAGRARATAMGGALYRGPEAVRAGLATHVADSEAELPLRARALCAALASKPPHALRTTKAWLNELDGAAAGVHYAHAAEASASAAEHEEFPRLLHEFWSARKG